MSLLTINPDMLLSGCSTCMMLLTWCNASHILTADVVVIFGLFEQASARQMILVYISK